MPFGSSSRLGVANNLQFELAFRLCAVHKNHRNRNMSRLSQPKLQHHRATSALAGALVLLVVGLGLLGVRPDWHASFHALTTAHEHPTHSESAAGAHDHEAPAQNHDDAGCAIELFASGQVELLATATGPLLPPQITFLAGTSSLAGLSAHLGLAPPGRAPPSLS